MQALETPNCGYGVPLFVLLAWIEALWALLVWVVGKQW